MGDTPIYISNKSADIVRHKLSLELPEAAGSIILPIHVHTLERADDHLQHFSSSLKEQQCEISELLSASIWSPGFQFGFSVVPQT